MEKGVFYIEQEKMLRSMFEIAFKHKDAKIYTIDSLVGNYYLIDDLIPEIIVFDVKTVGPDLEKILQLSARFILIGTGDLDDQAKVLNRVKHFILKPIPAKNLVKTILGFATTIE